jgi:hypothetical protein
MKGKPTGAILSKEEEEVGLRSWPCSSSWDYVAPFSPAARWYGMWRVVGRMGGRGRR